MDTKVSRERLKIAFVTNLAPYYRRPLFERLAERHSVDFFFFSAGGERYLTEALRQDAVRSEGAGAACRSWSICGQAMMPGLRKQLCRERYDVVIKCLNGKLMTPWVFALATRRRIPSVLWTGMWYHPQTPLHRMTAGLARRLYQRAGAIVVYGEHVKRFLTEEQETDGAKIFVAGQAVEGAVYEAAAQTRVDTRRDEILYVGQLEARKGIEVLLSAFGGIRSPTARLTLIGDGSLRVAVERVAASDERVTVLGHLPQAALPMHLATARCLVVPSVTTKTDREPWALVANEAMHARTPVVATTAVGAAAGGLIQHAVNGLVVPEGEVEPLRKACEWMLAHPRGASEMGRRAQADVQAFNYDVMLDAFEEAAAFAIRQAR